MSVSPVALSVGLVSSGECWLLAYSVWLGVLTYLFYSPMWKCFLHCGQHLPHPMSLSDVFLVASVLASMSSLSPKLEYLERTQLKLLPKDLHVHLSLPRCVAVAAASVL